MKILILIFFLWVFMVESKYEVIFDRAEQNDDGTFWDIGTSRVRKFNRSSAVISGVVTVKLPIDNTYKVAFEAYNLSGGQYKKIFGQTVGNFCDVLYAEENKNLFLEIMAKTNSTTSHGTCPFPPQTVQINDVSTNNVGDILPEYIPGNERWKLIGKILKNDKVCAEIISYVILRDNQKLFDSKW